MRKVIFRGLNKKGEWVYGDLVNCEGIKHMPKQNTKTWIVTSAFGNGGWFNIRHRQYVLPETVGQFTGLKDKHGVGIFEGDILKCEDGFLWVVKWTDNNCGFMAEGEDISTINMESEIIGNTHQNKELPRT